MDVFTIFWWPMSFVRSWRKRQVEKRLVRSGFDRNWYLDQYPDVRDSNIEPLRHYMTWGIHEQRDPNPLFSTSFYLAENPDVKRDDINPFAHYLQYGWAE